MVKGAASSIAAIAACAALTAACAQLLGIETVHDDPADAALDVSPATTGDDAPDVGQAGDDASDASRDALDARVPTDTAPGIDPLRGCTGPDGGPVSIFPSVSTYPIGVLADPANIYVADVNGIRRCSLEGCEAGVLTVIASQPAGFALTDSHVAWGNNVNLTISDQNGNTVGGWLANAVTHVATYHNDIYWSGNDAVIRHGNDGLDAASNVVFDLTPFSADSLVTNGHYVFYVEYSGDAAPGRLLRCDAPSCAGGPTLMSAVTNVDPSNGLHPALAVDDTSIYWSDPVEGVVHACDVSGCDTGERTLATGVQATSLFVDANALYWTTPDYSPGGNGQVHKTPLDGGPTVSMFTGDRYPNHVMANAACIYWTTSGLPSIPRGHVYGRPQP